MYISFFAFSLSFAMYDAAVAFRVSVSLFTADADAVYHVDDYDDLLR